jgi:molybdopterin converting factor small subunit
MGTGRMEVVPPPGATVASVMAAAAEAVGVDPAVMTTGRLLFAVNRERVGPDHPVADGDEVAALPPLSGGV